MYVTAAQCITNGTMTGTAVVTGDTIGVRNMIQFSVQCVWTGTPTGVFKVQATNDEKIISTTTWTDLSTSSGPLILNGSQPAGSASNLMLCSNATGCPWTFVRVIYTNASGSGTCNAFICAKGA